MKIKSAPIALFLLTLSLVALVAAGSGFAQQENLLGIFYDQEATIDEIEINGTGTYSLYLVLMQPVNNDFDGGGSQDVTLVGGFECAIMPAAGDALLNATYPLEALNFGDLSNMVVGFGSGLPVGSNNQVTLATLEVFSMGNNREGYKLSPTAQASSPNSMAYLDFQDPVDALVEMGPASGSYDRAVFTFGDYSVSEEQTWDAVKSLYK